MTNQRYIREPDHDKHFARDDDPGADSETDPDDDGWIDTEASKVEFVVPIDRDRDVEQGFDKFSILRGLYSILLSFLSSADDPR